VTSPCTQRPRAARQASTARRHGSIRRARPPCSRCRARLRPRGVSRSTAPAPALSPVPAQHQIQEGRRGEDTGGAYTVRGSLCADRTPQCLARMRASSRTRVRVRADARRAGSERADKKKMLGPDGGGGARGWPWAHRRDMQRTSRSAGGRRMGGWGSSEGGKKCGNVPCARGAGGMNVHKDLIPRGQEIRWGSWKTASRGARASVSDMRMMRGRSLTTK
jgi:hypothetical protein